jgi:hypothetical protein
MLKTCSNEEDLRTTLKEQKLWRVAFKEDEDFEDKVPGYGWCGYLAIDQIIRQSDEVATMDKTGINRLRATLEELIKCSKGGVRTNWKKYGSRELTTREVLLSVKDTLDNWGSRLKDSLERSRWLNAKNIYGTCGMWDYSQWGTDPEEQGYCELRDSHATQGSTTNLEEWRWALVRNMVVGARGHYYVRKGGLIEDFEMAFQEAMECAVAELRPRLIAASQSVEKIRATTNIKLEDVAVGYSDQFHEAIRLRGRKVLTVEGDGYCLFHAVAVGLGRPGDGMEIFNQEFSALENRREEPQDFVDGSVEDYLEKLKGGYGEKKNLPANFKNSNSCKWT